MELLTVSEVAAILKCTPKCVRQKFGRLPGVVDLGTAETRAKRGRKMLRIPRVVLERFLIEKTLS